MINLLTEEITTFASANDNLTLQYFGLSMIFLVCFFLIFGSWMYARWHIWGPRYKKLWSKISFWKKDPNTQVKGAVISDKIEEIDKTIAITTQTSNSAQELLKLQIEKENLQRQLVDEKAALEKMKKRSKIFFWKKKAVASMESEIIVKENIKQLADVIGTTHSNTTSDSKAPIAVAAATTTTVVANKNISLADKLKNIDIDKPISEQGVKPLELSTANVKPTEPIKPLTSVKPEVTPVVEVKPAQQATQTQSTNKKYKWNVLSKVEWRGSQYNNGGVIEDTDNNYMRKLASQNKVQLPEELNNKKEEV